jgi:hypothetical protein
VLVLPDVRAAMNSKNKNSNDATTAGKKEKKGISGFFKNLFGKKETDSTAMLAPSLSTSDSTSVNTPQKNSKKKKSKKGKTEEVKKKDDAKKEEDDGF